MEVVVYDVLVYEKYYCGRLFVSDNIKAYLLLLSKNKNRLKKIYHLFILDKIWNHFFRPKFQSLKIKLLE